MKFSLLSIVVILLCTSCKVRSAGNYNLDEHKDCVFEITYNGSENNIISILKSANYNDKVMDVEQVVKQPGLYSVSSMRLVCRDVDDSAVMQIRKELQKCNGVLSVVVGN